MIGVGVGVGCGPTIGVGVGVGVGVGPMIGVGVGVGPTIGVGVANCSANCLPTDAAFRPGSSDGVGMPALLRRSAKVFPESSSACVLTAASWPAASASKLNMAEDKSFTGDRKPPMASESSIRTLQSHLSRLGKNDCRRNHDLTTCLTDCDYERVLSSRARRANPTSGASSTPCLPTAPSCADPSPKVHPHG